MGASVWKEGGEVNPTIALYEPPISHADFPENFWEPTIELAPGVQGFAFRSKDGNLIFIPMIAAEHEGNGDVGRFLDRLSARCVIMAVTSKRLEGMLERRGYTMAEFDNCDFWARK